ncbi:MAG: RNA polymerase sigma factor [Planctomycetota bacterium]|jgi:RNA polymerase sigma-70 factor (ECF subfamily)
MGSAYPPPIEDLQRMDEAAWTVVQEHAFRRVYYFVRKFTNDHQTAEDLAQDVFLGAIRGIDRFDPAFTLDQYLFGIARNRVVDHLRKHRPVLMGSKDESDGDGQARAWIEDVAADESIDPAAGVVVSESLARQRRAMGEVLREFVGELWSAGEFRKLMVLEYLFVCGGRNKEAAVRFGFEEEKHVAGIKFRAIEKLRGLARQWDPNHSLFIGLWKPGAR